MKKSTNLFLLALLAFFIFLEANPLFSKSAPPFTTIKPFEDGFNEDTKMVVSALSAVAKGATKWASIANEMLLDLPKYSNAQIHAMYKNLLTQGRLKISTPTRKIKELGKYCVFTFNLDELKEKGDNCQAYLISSK
jgi:hypothetical protein